MMDSPRNKASLEKLLKLARADADAQRMDLLDIEEAKLTAQVSLNNLDATVREEEKVVKSSGAEHFAAYLSGVRERRLNLVTTINTLTNAEEAARDKLEAAFAEMKKLEHLIEIINRTEKKRGARKDALSVAGRMPARRIG